MGLTEVVLVVVLGYIGLCAAFYGMQDLFFFRPELLPRHFDYRFSFPFEELDFRMPDGGRVNALWFRVPNAKGVVFYLKGNSRSIKGWSKYAMDYLAHGHDFFIFDYRGFGKSRGRRTERRLFADCAHLYSWLRKHYSPEEVVLYGRSFGSGLAAWLAAHYPARVLILDSPYYSFYHAIRRFAFFLPIKWLLRYHIRTDRYIEKVTCPVHIFHGSRDGLFPLWHSRRLVERCRCTAQLHIIDGAGHNDLPKYREYYEMLYEILNPQANAQAVEDTT